MLAFALAGSVVVYNREKWVKLMHIHNSDILLFCFFLSFSTLSFVLRFGCGCVRVADCFIYHLFLCVSNSVGFVLLRFRFSFIHHRSSNTIYDIHFFVSFAFVSMNANALSR